MSRQHQQGLHTTDARRLKIRLQDLAGVGGEGIASLSLGLEGRRRLIYESNAVREGIDGAGVV
jgi:hypothetical protein